MMKFGLLIAVFLLGAEGCGSSCNVLSRFMSEPSCRTLLLSAKRTVKPFNTACGSVANSRKLTVHCPAGAGTTGQCTSLANGFPVYSVLLPNNNSGSFKDADGTVYATCSDILTALGTVPPAIQNVAGYYVSDNSSPAETLSCTDTGGCSLTSVNCYAGWDPVTRGISGTASLTGPYLTCTYIDNSSLVTPSAPASTSPWTLPISSVNATTSPINFGVSAGWGNAY